MLKDYSKKLNLSEQIGLLGELNFLKIILQNIQILMKQYFVGKARNIIKILFFQIIYLN